MGLNSRDDEILLIKSTELLIKIGDIWGLEYYELIDLFISILSFRLLYLKVKETSLKFML